MTGQHQLSCLEALQISGGEQCWMEIGARVLPCSCRTGTQRQQPPGKTGQEVQVGAGARAGPMVSAMAAAARQVSQLSAEACEGLEELQSVHSGVTCTFIPSWNR